LLQISAPHPFIKNLSDDTISMHPSRRTIPVNWEERLQKFLDLYLTLFAVNYMLYSTLGYNDFDFDFDDFEPPIPEIDVK
jgi:hypothetical protein